MPNRDCCDETVTCENYRHDTKDCKKPIKKVHTDYYHTTHIQPVKYITTQRHNITKIYDPIIEEKCKAPTNKCIYVPCNKYEENKCEQTCESTHDECESKHDECDSTPEECQSSCCCCCCCCYNGPSHYYNGSINKYQWWLNGQ